VKVRFNAILAIGLSLAAGNPLRAADFSAGTGEKPIPVGQRKAGPEKSHAKAHEPERPSSLGGWVKDHNWQKQLELRSGRIYFLRRSTDTPPEPGDIVLVRWRTPTEFRRQTGLSSKGTSPAAQRVIDRKNDAS
jgi:hypothetical protein